MSVLAELLDAVSTRAETEPDVVLPVLQLLAQPDGTHDGAVTHLAARRVNAERLTRAEQAFRADALGTAQVRERLAASRQAVHARVTAGHLLAAKVGSRLVYPGWQFTPAGLVSGLREVLSALRSIAPLDAGTDGTGTDGTGANDTGASDVRAADAIMRAPQSDRPGEASLVELLAAGHVDEVLRLLTLRADQS